MMTTKPEAALALGRILRMASRPEQPGDVIEYERCRAIILNAIDAQSADYTPNVALDYGKGAAGQW